MAAVRGIVTAVAAVAVVMVVMAVVVTEAKVVVHPKGLSEDSKYRLKTIILPLKAGSLPVWLHRFNDDGDDDVSDVDSDPSSDVTSDEDDEGSEEEEKGGSGPLTPPPSRKRRSIYIDLDDDEFAGGSYRRYRSRYGGYRRYGRRNRYGRRGGYRWRK